MSDPFGRDDADFDTEQMCLDAYGNAVEYLRERDVGMPAFRELECADEAVARNPLLGGNSGSPVAAKSKSVSGRSKGLSA